MKQNDQKIGKFGCHHLWRTPYLIGICYILVQLVVNTEYVFVHHLKGLGKRETQDPPSIGKSSFDSNFSKCDFKKRAKIGRAAL